MPQRLDELEVLEVSLVDRGANQGARVALWKRDSSNNEVTNREKSKMPSLQEVINKRSATRDEISAAVDERAVYIAKKCNISPDQARAIVWSDNAVYAAYTDAPVPVAKKAEPKMMEATAAEGLLHRRTLKLMKSNPQLSYPQAATRAMSDDPSIYEKYTAEMQAGKTYSVPDPQYLDIPLNKQSRDDEDDDPGECDDCGEEIGLGANFCSGCGSAVKSNAKAKASHRS